MPKSKLPKRFRPVPKAPHICPICRESSPGHVAWAIHYKTEHNVEEPVTEDCLKNCPSRVVLKMAYVDEDGELHESEWIPNVER